jgi:hypothetical protein
MKISQTDDHSCSVCGAPNSPFGKKDAATNTVWFCRDHFPGGKYAVPPRHAPTRIECPDDILLLRL